MGYNATAHSGEYHVLFDVVLDATTLRFADEDIDILTSNTTGFYYEGRVFPGSTLRRAMGSILEPKEYIETFTMKLDNRDGAIQGYLETYKWANRAVNIWLGEGHSKSNYSNVFPATVVHPNGISWDESEAQILLADRRIKDRRELPSETFTTATYPNLESKAKEKQIPIWFGDWRSTVGNGLSVPAYCVNTATKQFKICGHGVKQVERVLKNAIALNLTTQVTNISLSTASFNLSTGVSWNATSDVISVNGQGVKTANGTLVESVDKILRTIYTNFLGLTSTDLNITNFHTLSTEVDFVFRRFIDTTISSEELIGSLLNESQTDMRFSGGKYSPKYRTLDAAENRVDYRDVDIAINDDENAVFSVQRDPDRTYCNRVRSKFDYDPVNECYNQNYTYNATAAQEDDLTTTERLWDMQWHYLSADAQTRIEREVVEYSNEPVWVNTQLTHRALTKSLADQIDITYNVFEDRPFIIRKMDTDLLEMTTTVAAYNLFAGAWGRWTADTAPSWLLSTSSQRQTQGYWSDDSGYINTPNVDSFRQSLWY